MEAHNSESLHGVIQLFSLLLLNIHSRELRKGLLVLQSSDHFPNTKQKTQFNSTKQNPSSEANKEISRLLCYPKVIAMFIKGHR